MARRKKKGSRNPKRLTKKQRSALPQGKWIPAMIRKVGRSIQAKVRGPVAKRLRKAKR